MDPDKVNHEFEALLDFLKRNRGFDFTGYKRASLVRRVNKRMQEVDIQHYLDYINYLEVHPDEFTHLFNTILINVTGFFRDAEAWEYLASEIVPQILDEQHPADGVRVWCTGAASGEEAYTCAMVLAEAMGEEAFRDQAKIYATDVDEDALGKARHGSYTAKAVEDIPKDLLEKYFELNSGRYAFRKNLRGCLIFGRHDLVQDAPISRIDLLICRNVLMYLNSETQSRVLARLHFALRKGGFVFLGKAEMLLSYTNQFTPVNLRYRVFKKTAHSNYLHRKATFTQTAGKRAVNNIQEQITLRDLLFDSSPDARIVLNREGELIMANERARSLFGLNSGDLGQEFHNLELSFRPVDLRSPISRAVAELNPITLKEIEMRTSHGQVSYFDVQVNPLVEAGRNLLGVSITFVDVSTHKNLYLQLEHANQELETAMEELQSTNEELETTNEELHSTIEELETTNEELQSANEELETINEELQSTNQEMVAINDILRERNQAYNQVNAFLQAILESMGGGVVVLDPELRVQIWNKKSEDLWGLRAEEAQGKHFLNLDFGLPVEQLTKRIRTCLNGDCQETTVTLEARNRLGRDFICRITINPLVDSPNNVHGVILVMEQEAGDSAGVS